MIYETLISHEWMRKGGWCRPMYKQRTWEMAILFHSSVSRPMESWKFHESASRAGSYAFIEVQRGRKRGGRKKARERSEREREREREREKILLIRADPSSVISGVESSFRFFQIRPSADWNLRRETWEGTREASNNFSFTHLKRITLRERISFI